MKCEKLRKENLLSSLVFWTLSAGSYFFPFHAAAAPGQYHGPPYKLTWGGDWLDGGEHPSIEAAAEAWWQIEIVSGNFDQPGGCHWELRRLGPRLTRVVGVGPPDGCVAETFESWGTITPTRYPNDEQRDLGSPRCNAEGNPVNAAVGNKYQREVDFDSGTWLKIERIYNSGKGAMPSAFGKRWNGNFDSRLAVLGPENPMLPRAVAVLRADGGKAIHLNIDGVWSALDDSRWILSERISDDGTTTGWLYKDKLSGEQEKYSAAGELQSIVDSQGLETSLEYSDAATGLAIAPHAGLLIRATDPLGRSLNFFYDNFARVRFIQLPDDQVIEYKYHDGYFGEILRDTLAEVVYQDGESRRYSYNSGRPDYDSYDQAYLDEIAYEQGGGYSHFEYDASGRAIRSGHAGGVGEHSFSYQSEGRTRIKYPSGLEVEKLYARVNGSLQLTENGSPCFPLCGVKWKARRFDSFGRVAETSGFNGERTILSHNIHGQVVEMREQSGDSNILKVVQFDWQEGISSPTESRTYDAARGLIQRVVFEYNARGQMLKQIQYDSSGDNSRSHSWRYCESDEVEEGWCPLAGLVTSASGPGADGESALIFQYFMNDHAGCNVSVRYCLWRRGDLKKVTNSVGHSVEVLGYDSVGRIRSFKEPNGVVIDYEYHPRGWIVAKKVRGAAPESLDDAVTTFDYYPSGLVKSQTLPDGNIESYVYDTARRLTDILDADGNRLHYTLDMMGNRIGEDVFSELGVLRRTLSRGYDKQGQMTVATDSQGASTTYAYDASGNTLSISDPLGRVTAFTYDPLRRLIQVGGGSEGGGASTMFQYDGLDRLTEVVDPKGLITTYVYNGLGDLTAELSPDRGVTTFTVDDAGNRSARTDARGVTAKFRYDAVNRLTDVSYPDMKLDLVYTYDVAPDVCGAGERFPIGRLGSVLHARGSTEYCHDRFGNVTRKVQTIDGVVTTLSYTYTKAGQLGALGYPDGSLADYVRDSLGRVTEVGLTRPGRGRQVVISSITHEAFGPATGWTYGNGRRLARPVNLDYQPQSVYDAATGGLSLSYGYDASGMIAELSGMGGEGRLAKYDYDDLGRLVRTRDGATDTVIEAYAYDSTGNRTALSTASGVVEYSYPAESHRLAEVNGERREYDDAGNSTRVGSKEFIFNDANRISVMKSYGAVVEGYSYNHRGERVLRSSASGDAQIALYDEAGQWIGSYNSDGQAQQQIIWLDNYPIALISLPSIGIPELAYIQPDHLGTPRVVIDPVRDVAIWEWHNTSEAFGDQLANTDPDGDGVSLYLALRFPGQQASDATGMYYNYQRDYDPLVGRYLQSDPIGLMGGISTYGYADGNPLSIIDATGLQGRRPNGSFGRPGGGNAHQRAIHNSAQVRAIQNNSHTTPIYSRGIAPDKVASAENLASIATGLDYTQYCAAELCRNDPLECSESDRVVRNWLPSDPTVAQVHARGCVCVEPYYSGQRPISEPKAGHLDVIQLITDFLRRR